MFLGVLRECGGWGSGTRRGRRIQWGQIMPLSMECSGKHSSQQHTGFWGLCLDPGQYIPDPTWEVLGWLPGGGTGAALVPWTSRMVFHLTSWHRTATAQPAPNPPYPSSCRPTWKWLWNEQIDLWLRMRTAATQFRCFCGSRSQGQGLGHLFIRQNSVTAPGETFSGL